MTCVFDCALLSPTKLAPTIGLADIPHVIPVLRMQQNQLDYLCDVTNMPKRSPFTRPVEHMMKVSQSVGHACIRVSMDLLYIFYDMYRWGEQ